MSQEIRWTEKIKSFAHRLPGFTMLGLGLLLAVSLGLTVIVSDRVRYHFDTDIPRLLQAQKLEKSLLQLELAIEIHAGGQRAAPDIGTLLSDIDVQIAMLDAPGLGGIWASVREHMQSVAAQTSGSASLGFLAERGEAAMDRMKGIVAMQERAARLSIVGGAPLLQTGSRVALVLSVLMTVFIGLTAAARILARDQIRKQLQARGRGASLPDLRLYGRFKRLFARPETSAERTRIAPSLSTRLHQRKRARILSAASESLDTGHATAQELANRISVHAGALDQALKRVGSAHDAAESYQKQTLLRENAVLDDISNLSGALGSVGEICRAFTQISDRMRVLASNPETDNGKNAQKDFGGQSALFNLSDQTRRASEILDSRIQASTALASSAEKLLTKAFEMPITAAQDEAGTDPLAGLRRARTAARQNIVLAGRLCQQVEGAHHFIQSAAAFTNEENADASSVGSQAEGFRPEKVA